MSLPALALRSTRLRLLAATYEDALTSGTQDGSGPDAHGSRLLLHDDLWTLGSYQELERLLPATDRWFRRTYLGVAFKDHPARDIDQLRVLERRMPRDIFVPALVALNAGYLEGEAGRFVMPERERLRRFHRQPVRA